jgi:hypothetical protein
MARVACPWHLCSVDNFVTGWGRPPPVKRTPVSTNVASPMYQVGGACDLLRCPWLCTCSRGCLRSARRPVCTPTRSGVVVPPHAGSRVAVASAEVLVLYECQDTVCFHLALATLYAAGVPLSPCDVRGQLPWAARVSTGVACIPLQRQRGLYHTLHWGCACSHVHHLSPPLLNACCSQWAMEACSFVCLFRNCPCRAAFHVIEGLRGCCLATIAL